LSDAPCYKKLVHLNLILAKMEKVLEA
jgi:hypothetical protein